MSDAFAEPSDPRRWWPLLSQAERDLAYNNNAAASDAAELIEERNAASAAFRKAHPEKLDLPYGPRERNKVDLFPGKDPKAPCFFFIHGGYWQRNAREDFAMLAEGLNAHGWSVAFPGYTLCPDVTLTELTAECVAALDWLAKDGPKHGVAGPVILSGWSAGGHLAAMCLSHKSVVAGLALSGVYELAPIRDTYLQEKLKLTEDELATLSPLRLPVVQKPMAIAYGSKEVSALVNDAQYLYAKRSAAHAAGALIPIAGANHFSMLRELRSPTGELTRAALGLAAQYA